MPRFTLQPGCWHAMETIEPDAQRHLSPIWLQALRPLGAGNGCLEIKFYHAVYPEGVRDKTYVLRVRRRAAGYLLAEQMEQAPSRRRLLILEIMTADWLRRNFPELQFTATGGAALSAELDILTARRPGQRDGGTVS